MRRMVMTRVFGVWAVCLAAGCGDKGGDDDESTLGPEPVDTTSTSSTSSTSGDDTTGLPTTSEGSSTTSIVEPTSTGDTTDGPDPTTTGGPVEGACDPKAQDCPEGSKCTAYGKMAGDAWNANKCVPEIENGGVAGDACAVEGEDVFTGIDDCAKGFICLNTDEQGKNGFCVEFCDADNLCPNTSSGSGLCLPDSNDGFLPICLATCDPLLQDCPGSQACYGDPSMPFFICFNPDPQDNDGQEGDSCEFTNACLGGLHCASAAVVDGCDPMSSGCCTPFCPLDGTTCKDPEVCTAFFADPTPGFENVGVCSLP